MLRGWTRQSLATIAEETIEDLQVLETYADRQLENGSIETAPGVLALLKITEAGKPLAGYILQAMLMGEKATKHRKPMMVLHRNVAEIRNAVENGNWRWVA